MSALFSNVPVNGCPGPKRSIVKPMLFSNPLPIVRELGGSTLGDFRRGQYAPPKT
jgi:hypothetical protein